MLKGRGWGWWRPGGCRPRRWGRSPWRPPSCPPPASSSSAVALCGVAPGTRSWTKHSQICRLPLFYSEEAGERLLADRRMLSQLWAWSRTSQTNSVYGMRWRPQYYHVSSQRNFSPELCSLTFCIFWWSWHSWTISADKGGTLRLFGGIFYTIQALQCIFL